MQAVAVCARRRLPCRPPTPRVFFLVIDCAHDECGRAQCSDQVQFSIILSALLLRLHLHGDSMLSPHTNNKRRSFRRVCLRVLLGRCCSFLFFSFTFPPHFLGYRGRRFKKAKLSFAALMVVCIEMYGFCFLVRWCVSLVFNVISHCFF